MASQKKFVTEHYDKLLLAGAGVLLVISGFYAFVKGPAAVADAERDFARQLDKFKSEPADKALAEASPYAYGAALRAMGDPWHMGGTNIAFLAAPERVACVSCFRPIPLSADVCPVCGTAQPSDVVGDDWDGDGDGIPDAWEKKNGLNPLDPGDAHGDPDGDGFSNKEEFDAGTDPRNPASHPPRFAFLRVAKVEATPFPYLLSGKIRMPGDQYKFQINGPRGITHTIKKGDELDKSGFILSSYTTRKGVLKRPGLPDKETDLFVLSFKRGVDEVELQEGREAVSSAYEVTLFCEKDKNPKEITVKRNESFAFDGERFTLVDVRRSANAAAIRRESTGEVLQVPSK